MKRKAREAFEADERRLLEKQREEKRASALAREEAEATVRAISRACLLATVASVTVAAVPAEEVGRGSGRGEIGNEGCQAKQPERRGAVGRRAAAAKQGADPAEGG